MNVQIWPSVPCTDGERAKWTCRDIFRVTACEIWWSLIKTYWCAFFRSQNAGLSVRHFHTYHQSINLYTFWRNPHLLVCFLPEMAFLPWLISSPLQAGRSLQAVTCGIQDVIFPGLVSVAVCVCVCVVRAAIGAIRFLNASITMDGQTFSPIAYFSIQDQTFSKCLH